MNRTRILPRIFKLSIVALLLAIPSADLATNGSIVAPAEAAPKAKRTPAPTQTPASTPTPAATPTPGDGGGTGAAARPLFVTAPSIRHVVVTFDRAPDASAMLIGSYSIVAGKAALPIHAVARIGTTNAVVITTGPQASVRYTFKYGKFSDRFVGSVNPEPALVGAEAVDPTHVVLIFSDPMAESAASAGLYQVRTAAAPGHLVGVVSAALGEDDPFQVVLTTATLAASTDYVVEAGAAESQAGPYLDPAESTAEFNTDALVPRLLSAEPQGEEAVLLTFSQPLAASAANPALYSATPDHLVVNSATLTSGNTQVLLATSPHFAGVAYTITASGVTDAFGTPLAADGDSATFTGLRVVLRLISAEPQGEEAVLLTFNLPLAASAADPALYSATPSHLAIESATLTNGNTQVLLGTTRHYAIEYTITASNGVTAASGVALAADGDSATFTGLTAISADRPRVVGAISTGNTGVVVHFSKPMADIVENPGRYAIVQENVNPEVGALGVVAAEFISDDRLSVQLTTRSQNEVTYKVTVSTVTDIFGNPMADREIVQGVLVDPTSFVFPGTPPTGEDRVDTDEDGLSDNEEVLGWVVTIRLADGGTTSRQVTGSPDSDDTDQDGLGDATEKSLGIDPRDPDTDDDGLTDYAEFNETFSDPLAQDTDADTLGDGLEFTFFLTSPILADTDGDKFLDADEVNLETRNPRAGDLPEPTLEIGEMRMDLDVRFTQVVSEEVVEVDSRTETATLVQSESQELANSHAATIETAAKVANSTEFKVTAAFPPAAEASLTNTISSEFSAGASYTGTWSETSTQATQETYEESLSTTEQISESASVTREVVGARMLVAITLKNAGDVAFTIKNMQVSALVQDPRNPERLTPIATLLPVEPDAGFNLGPLTPERGPIIFQNDELIPQVVEALMKDPRGVVFRFANYDLLAEDGRNFAFTSQDINDRTAGLIIDFGGADSDEDGQGDLSEIERVATGTGRRIDTDGNGVIDEADRFVVFDANGQQVGITLRDALRALGLTEYDESVDPTASLTFSEREQSYSVERSGESERIFRVRQTALRPDLAQKWYVITPTGIDENLTLDDVIVNAGETHTVAFLQDVDGDGMPATWEFLNRCSDQNIDTDEDQLDDRFELLGGWDVATERSIRHVFSSCANADTDRDGLTDFEEAPGVLVRDERGLIRFPTEGDPDAPAPARDTSGVDPNDLVAVSLADPITDPNDVDTDDDELRDRFELDGFAVTLRSPPAPPNTTVFVVTSPEFFDTDGDTASDGLERRLGGNPTDGGDADSFEDTDGDGLVNAQEEDGWDVTVTTVSLVPAVCNEVCNEGSRSTSHRISDPFDPDTDGDGLSDAEELLLLTDPTEPDTDFDGLTDDQEAFGFETQSFGFLFTDPLDADTDDDKRTDGEEVAQGLIVRVPGQAPYQVFTNPIDPDQDFDRLVDGDEETTGTDPANHDTDGDTRSDYVERLDVRTRPTVPDLIVTVQLGHVNVQQDCDSGDGDAGDWYFTFDVMRPDGDAQHLATSSLAKVAAGYPARAALPNCASGGATQCYGDNGDSDPPNDAPAVGGSDLQVARGDRIRLDQASTTFSVSNTSALPESFHVFGEVSEFDNDIPNAGNGFPWLIDIFSEPSTLVQGSDLQRGVQTLEIPFPSNEAGSCELSFRAVYHVQ
jgi:hypothetical protein